MQISTLGTFRWSLSRVSAGSSSASRGFSWTCAGASNAKMFPDIPRKDLGGLHRFNTEYAESKQLILKDA